MDDLFDDPNRNFEGDTNAYGAAAPLNATNYDIYGNAITSDGLSNVSPYAKAGGAAASSIVGLLYGNKQLQDQKKITSQQHQQYLEQYQNAMKDSSQNEIGIDRTGARAANDQRAAFGARGMGNSSAAEQGQEDMNYNQGLQLDALRRQRALMTSGFDAQQKVWQLQNQSGRAGQQGAVLQSGIGMAASLLMLL